ncbi:hypothetical protein SOVF_061730 [Spinacia oleracea]|nr:hypothetical protein SOVF_061730 [Spinacia oleracea]
MSRTSEPKAELPKAGLSPASELNVVSSQSSSPEVRLKLPKSELISKAATNLQRSDMITKSSCCPSSV